MLSPRIARLAPARKGPRFAVLSPEDHIEIQSIVAAYGRLYDDGLMDDFMDLFSDDAVFYPNWPGVAPDQVEGKAALSEFFRGARAGTETAGIQPRHYGTNLIVSTGGKDSAEATVGMLYAESKQGGAVELKMLGQYDYALEKRDGRWSIVRWSMRYDK